MTQAPRTSSATVQTVLGRVSADSLGSVDAHEHLFLRTPALPGDDFTDLDRLVDEAGMVKRSGIDTIVELTPVGLGRDPVKLATLSRRGGVAVVAATGYHRDAHYPSGHWVYHEPAEQLAEVLIADLTTGMDARDWQGPLPSPTEHRAGIIKLGASYQRISRAEERRLIAGAHAAGVTGAPIAVHCEIGTMACDILDRLADGGISADRIMLAHMDRNPDPALHADLAQRGAFLLYDTVGRIKYHPESALLGLVAAMADRGQTDRLLLGTDVGRSSMLRAYGGGPGMAVLGETFLPRLAAELGPEVVQQIMRHNPARALAWSRPQPR